MIPKPVRTLTITPSLPPSLERLRELAYNVRWAWDENTVDLFRRLGADLWQSSGHNPVKMLTQTSAARLEELAEDEGFVAHLNEVCASFDAYMQEDSTWYSRAHENDKLLAAYFSAEFWRDRVHVTFCWRTRGIGRRSPQECQRSWSPHRWSWPHVSTGILHSISG